MKKQKRIKAWALINSYSFITDGHSRILIGPTEESVSKHWKTKCGCGKVVRVEIRILK